MKSRIYLLILPAVLLLHSCGLYRNYNTPAVEYDTEVLCSRDTVSQSVASLSWRELFTDSLLVELIDSALIRNTDLRMAQLKTKEAAATLTASRLAFLPSFSLKAEGGISNTSPANFTIAPSASWEIDIFGKQRNLKEGAKAAFYASEAYRQAVHTQLIATVASSYFTLLMLDEQLSISERTLKTWDENIRALQALKRAGRTNEAIVLQARANRTAVENSVLSLRNRIYVQENAIRSLLLSPDWEIERGSLNEQIFPDSLTEGIPLEYLSKRPDVREAEFRLENAFYNVNVARAAFYPTLTLSGLIGWTTSAGNVANPSSWIGNALGAVVAPLFNRGTNKANLKIAQSEYEIAFLNFQQKLFDAGMEVNDALSAWQTSKNRVNLDKKQIAALQGAVHNTRLLMRNSTTNYLEVLIAQQRLLEAELTEASDRFEVIQAIINLYRSLGGGTE